MVELPSILSNYFNYNVTELRLPVLMESMRIFEEFNLPRYEEKYLDMMNDEEDHSPADIQAMIFRLVDLDLVKIIRAHKIEIAETAELTTPRLNVLCDALLKLQSLSDYSQVQRILSTDMLNEEKFAHLVNHLTGMEIIVCLSMVCDVTEDFFILLDELCVFDEKVVNCDDVCMKNEGREISISFFKFLGEHSKSTLGYKLLDLSTLNKSLTFEELLSLSTYDIIEKCKEFEEEHKVILNIMSVLMLGSDSRVGPSAYFRENSSMFGLDAEMVTKTYSMIGQVYKDFQVYLKEEEELNDE